MYTQDASFTLGKEKFNEDFLKTHDLLVDDYYENNAKRWFRPSGFFAKEYMYDILDEYNYTLVFGNKHSFDHQIRNTRYNLNQLIGRIQSGDIIIVHDLWDNLEFIEKLIVFLKQNNYKVVSLSDMTRICPSSVLKREERRKMKLQKNNK